MNRVRPKVQFGEVLRLVDTSVPANALAEVNLAGVYSFGRGLFKRGPMSPNKTSYKTYNQLVKDDYVISQPKAWEGAIARVTAEFDGWYLSPVFPTFRVEASRLDPKFLEWYCKREPLWAELQQKSRGIGARRETVSSDQFLSLEIPLPSLAEQRRIVARIDELAANIHEARSLRQQVVEDLETLCRVILSADGRVVKTPMKDLVRLRKPDVKVLPEGIYKFAGVYSFGRGLFSSQERAGMEFSYPLLTRLRTGDFTYPKLMAWEGAFGVVPEDCDGHVVSTEFPVFEVDQEVVLPEVLDVYFRSPTVWPEIACASTGTNVRRRRLNPKDFLDYRMPLPSKETQQKLRSVRQQVDILKRHQSETSSELEALLPALLDRTFAGDM